MKICVFGAGYVGLVTSACLAEMGNSVVCVDIDAARVEALQRGRIPIHEPGLDLLVVRNAAAERLVFTTDAAAAIAHGTVLFIAVGTPPAEDGSADVEAVLAAAKTIGKHMLDYKVVVDKSTVPVGTVDRVTAVIAEQLARRETCVPFAVVSNPEFLKEGSAIDDFMRPDRIIIGCESEQATLLLRSLYSPFLRNRDRMLVMDVRSAELTKYAANAMLATRISFMNELATLSERIGADIEQVRRGIGSDSRIGTQFLYAGCGWGGSCFPKDLRALARSGRDAGVDLSILEAVTRVNQRQRLALAERVAARFGDDLTGRTFAIWGLAFKAGTDDVREAPSIVIIEQLLRRGASVRAFDPVAMPNARLQFVPNADLTMVGDPLEAVTDASALLVVTEWREFRSPDFVSIRDRMQTPVVFDGRNLYEAQTLVDLGFEYFGIGRRAQAPNSLARELMKEATAA